MIYVQYLLFLLVVKYLDASLTNYEKLSSSLGKEWYGGRPGRPGRHGRPGRPNNNYIYECVPVGTCAGNSNGIDLRIVTPNQSICPPGQVPCYIQNQGITQCGIRSSPVSLNDGPSSYGAFPWQAYIENQTQFTGSGVLLDRYHVLTAAHKVNLNLNTPQNIRVFMGVWNPAERQMAQISTAARIILHEEFNPTTLVNDIAVIRLAQPVQLNNVVTPACLPAPQQSFIGQPNCVVSGWGQTQFGNLDAPTNPQKQVRLNIVDYQTCRASMSNPSVLGSNTDAYLDPNGEFCAGGNPNRDACTQDGGAPLVCPDLNGRYQVAGLVIWGIGCGRPNVYGVYVDVAKYRQFIDNAVAGRL